MRRFILGIVVGLIMGTAVSASASYIGTSRWVDEGASSAGQSFRLGYVAGVIDTIQALKRVSFFSRQTIAEVLDRVNECTAHLLLGQATDQANTALMSNAPNNDAANVIIAGFAKCQ
jgi:hypothetical protein